MLFREMILASASIYHKPEGKRHIRATGKERYFLGYRIFNYVHIVLREIVHQSAARIPRHKRHAHQIYFDSYRLLASPERDDERRAHRQESETHHHERASAKARTHLTSASHQAGVLSSLRASR